MSQTSAYPSSMTEPKSPHIANPVSSLAAAALKPQNHEEGPIAKAIENQTARLPSDLFLWAAGASIAVSLTLQLRGDKDDARFVGQWAPTFLILGLYNKLVKIAGHQGEDLVPGKRR